jgi:alpha-galactosidase
MVTSSPLPWGLVLEPSFDPPLPGAGVELAYDQAAGVLRVTVTGPPGGGVRPGRLRLCADAGFAAEGGWAWLQGPCAGDDAVVHAFGSLPDDDAPPGRRGPRCLSGDVCVLSLPARAEPVLLAGSLRGDRFAFDVELSLDDGEETLARVALVFDLEGIELGPGETLALPPVLLREGRDPVALLGQYAETLGREMHARPGDSTLSGWCGREAEDRVSESFILANLQAAARTGLPLEVIQAGHGYQSRTGDWLIPSDAFPSGMAALAARIREAGYAPGLWLAPLVVHRDSASLRERPAIALRDASGEVAFVDSWLGPVAPLDCTHPATEDWLREVVGTIVREWGYAYLELDLLSVAARPAAEVRYHRPGATGRENLRRGLEIIRQAAGSDVFILAGNCPFGAAVGLVDGMRVGIDARHTADAASRPLPLEAVQASLLRNWMHRRLWLNDPGPLLPGGAATPLSEAGVRFLATAVALGGGPGFLRDDLASLPPARLQLARALVPAAGVAARPVDPGEAPVPSSWRTDLGEGRALVGVLNWTNEPRWVVVAELLEPGEVAFDAWNGRVLGKGDLLLRAHEGTLWQVAAPGPTPRVVGDTGHLAFDGLYLRPVSGRIQVGNDLDHARMIAVEARGQVFEVELAPGERRWFD